MRVNILTRMRRVKLYDSHARRPTAATRMTVLSNETAEAGIPRLARNSLTAITGSNDLNIINFFYAGEFTNYLFLWLPV